MIWYVSSFRVDNFSLYSYSWDKWNLKSILAHLGMRYLSSLNPLSCFFFSHIQWWYATFFVKISFNRYAKFSWSDSVWHLIIASERDLCGYLFIVETCKTNGLKRVRLLMLLVPVLLFIVFVVSLNLCSFPFSYFFFRTWWVK